MASASPLPALREIRDETRAAEARKPERDRLIRQAAAEGKTEAQIAEASGLSPGRISQIKKLSH